MPFAALATAYMKRRAGLAFHSDIRHMPEFAAMVERLQDRFTTL